MKVISINTSSISGLRYMVPFPIVWLLSTTCGQNTFVVKSVSILVSPQKYSSAANWRMTLFFAWNHLQWKSLGSGRQSWWVRVVICSNISLGHHMGGCKSLCSRKNHFAQWALWMQEVEAYLVPLKHWSYQRIKSEAESPIWKSLTMTKSEI